MKYLAQCDKCFKVKSMKGLANTGTTNLIVEYYLPDNWEDTDLGVLCDECYLKYKRLINEWSVSKK